ncbi:shikimate 5-dehydrogenase [Marivirga lumbricoides]|uniref:Shikimate 5-dehydrogenase n=1 Tax=Marivirga lumbricoides TaxID=1046115 RepID=A0ABQ1N1D6_9BACT|nr:shikimate 5-dehydrogenase [Marivirga lumbricoides]
MKLLGLIGYPLGHSFSKAYFSNKFLKEGLSDYDYQLFPLKDISEFPALLNAFPNLKGLNVTIPYKEKVIPYLDELDESAEKIGAVNVIKLDNGKKTGYNSDYYGFRKSLQDFLPQNFEGKALVLGTGGASKAINFALGTMELPFQVVSRDSTRGLSYQSLLNNPELLRHFHLIVNTTPLGTYPSVEEKPDLPYDRIGENHFLYDLVYNPEQTAFMKEGIARNASVKNGYEMLVEQAEKAWEIWNE